ncbi:MAG: hypothetical protein QM503_10120 [Bacteroidota bacterium]
MNTYDSITYFDEGIEEQSQRWLSVFDETLDDSFWHGYAEEIKSSNPKYYERELWYFLSLYGEH